MVSSDIVLAAPLTKALARVHKIKRFAHGRASTLAASPHPKFPNPTISQVSCEIGFGRDLKLKLSTAELYKLLINDFPEIQAVGGMALQIVFDAGQHPAPPMPGVPAPAFRFATAAGDKFVQISDTSLIYHSTAKYRGWETVKTSILDTWTKVLPAIKPESVTKIGLRYVNRIAKDAEHPYVGHWLQASDYIPKVLLELRRHFLSRVEASPGDNEVLLITVVNQEAADTPQGAIVFDIDRIHSVPVAGDQLADVLETLHDQIWDVFWTSRTPALEEKLKGGGSNLT